MAEFQRMSDFSEIQDVNIEVVNSSRNDPNDPSDHYGGDSTQINQQGQFNPNYFSLNPLDWARDIKKEIQEFTWAMTPEKKVLLKAVFGEGLVTFLFLFIVEATSVNAIRSNNGGNLVLGAIATAFCSIALIYSFADVSGSHFNPAVTFATMVTGKTSMKKGLLYIGIQLFSSVMATIYLGLVFGNTPDPTTGQSATDYVIVTKSGDITGFRAFAMEFTLTFILVYVIFATAFDTVDTSNKIKVDEDIDDKQKTVANKSSKVGKHLTIYTTSGSSKSGFAPLAIGLTLGFLCFVGGSVSGGAFNPARVFGPAMVGGVWDNHWIYWCGDFLGAAAAGWTQQLFFSHDPVHSSSNIVAGQK